MAVTASHQGPLSGFLTALGARLAAGRAGAAPALAADIDTFLALLKDTAKAAPAATQEHGDAGEQLPVCRHWQAMLDAAATAGAGDLALPLRALAASLRWAQNPNYRRRPPDPAFLAGYGYAVIAGPPDGPPALVEDRRLALGVLLLGPGVHYPLHRHPAVEIYLPLSGDGYWWMGEGPWRRELPGALVHHAPLVPHATRAGDQPLLAVYLWRGDLATHARLVDAPAPAA